jgi:hypothetical protein
MTAGVRATTCAALWLCSSCIVTEEVAPMPDEIVQAVEPFEERCETDGYPAALSCLLRCNALEPSLAAFFGRGVVYDDGVARWRVCTRNRLGGVACQPAEQAYSVRCEPRGLQVTGPSETDIRAQVPPPVVDTSVLPSIAAGLYSGAPGSCLRTCLGENFE